MSARFRFVCATRVSQALFAADTALGRSLMRLRYPATELRLFADNRAPLGEVYNIALAEAASDPAILLFTHDDVHICDFFWPLHVLSGLRSFQVLGVAGNRRRVERQPAWHFVDDRFTWDAPENLSGVVGHGRDLGDLRISVYGGPLQEVKLLDGLLLIADSQVLSAADVRFDAQFGFHFYDLDFCRQAERAGLKMGTCPISVIHESSGGGATPAWHESYRRYLAKWGS